MGDDRDQRVAGVRDDVRAWLEGQFSSDLTLRTWWGRLADSGWGFPTWPKEWCGRDLGALEARAVADELARADVI
ncbi:MAG TPA: acyl-CoA dehydrogenase family protein, partial [Acidimicrobiales bacterium]|nr:acyl-CoA dehydrogenase family protein [Acidimicrobiales bacterium]